MPDNVRVVREGLSEVSLYIGSVEGYGGTPFGKDHLTQAVVEFQREHESQHEYLCPVRIEDCTFVCKDYREHGWEITVINYPRYPRTDSELCNFMRRMGVFLLHKFKQNRISIVARTRPTPTLRFDEAPGFIEMIESPEAEEVAK